MDAVPLAQYVSTTARSGPRIRKQAVEAEAPAPLNSKRRRRSAEKRNDGAEEREDVDAAARAVAADNAGCGARGVSGFFGVVDKRGRFAARIPPHAFGVRLATRHTWHVGVYDKAEDAGRWRDRYVIALHGPQGAARLELPTNFPIDEYREEPFFRALFGAGEPPPVGVHDPKGEADPAAAFDRLRNFLRALESQGTGGVRTERERVPPLQRNPSSGLFGVVFVRGNFIMRVRWLNHQFERSFLVGEEAARCRDRVSICCFGPEEAARRSLNFPPSHYQAEGFFRALFVDVPPEAVGVHDACSRQSAASKQARSDAVDRLQAFFARHAILPREKRVHWSTRRSPGTHLRRPETGLYGVYPAQLSPLRYAAFVPWRGREIRSHWAPEDVGEAARWRDRLLIVLRGPQVAARNGLNHPLEEYEGEGFFGALFGEGVDPPRVGLFDEEAREDPAGSAARAVRFLREQSAAGAPRAVGEPLVEEDGASEAACSEDGDCAPAEEAEAEGGGEVEGEGGEG
eukprot:tig00021489_g21683.t1